LKAKFGHGGVRGFTAAAKAAKLNPTKMAFLGIGIIHFQTTIITYHLDAPISKKYVELKVLRG
jgi:hypothetical protein